MRKLILILLIPFVLASCNIPISCPDFKEEILSWLPYQENDIVEFYSQQTDSTISFFIKNAGVSHTTHYHTGYKCGTCDDHIMVYSEDNSSPKFLIDISLNKNKITNQSYYIWDTFFTDYNSNYSEEKNYLFENNKYDIVRIFSHKDSKGTLEKLIIAKGFGVIGFEDIYGNCWSLKTDTKDNKSGDGEKRMKIINTSC